MDAVQLDAQVLPARFFVHDPGTILPGGIVTDMLRVSAFEIGNPVLFAVLMEADDAALHGFGRSFT